jgi:hypothetical protein
LFVTRQGSFKKVVRRHAAETGQRYTEALTDLEGLEARMTHEPVGERLVAHIRGRYGIDATAATRVSVHKGYVFRVDRNDGDPWIARAFPRIEARQLDGQGRATPSIRESGYPSTGMLPTSIVFSERGCWEVTARLDDAELVVVLNVT